MVKMIIKLKMMVVYIKKESNSIKNRLDRLNRTNGLNRINGLNRTNGYE